MRVLLVLALAFMVTATPINQNFWYQLTLNIKHIATSFVHDLFTKSPPTPDEAYKTPAEIVMTQGYQFETHKFQTADDYILTAWRIPGKSGETPEAGWNKPCVMLQHGLIDNSRSWLINKPESNLAFRLVEHGYDVWITNSRGNIESFEHMDPKTHSAFVSGSEFWRFSFDQMAEYDVPANLDYILEHTH
jgi:pimeloyl-ACP methyl ester carboxylesterase